MACGAVRKRSHVLPAERLEGGRPAERCANCSLASCCHKFHLLLLTTSSHPKPPPTNSRPRPFAYPLVESPLPTPMKLHYPLLVYLPQIHNAPNPKPHPKPAAQSPLAREPQHTHLEVRTGHAFRRGKSTHQAPTRKADCERRTRDASEQAAAATRSKPIFTRARQHHEACRRRAYCCTNSGEPPG